MVWIPEDMIWAKAYQLCGLGKDASPFWTAARQILEAQAQVTLADRSIQSSESRAQQAEQSRQEAESQLQTMEHSLQEANRKIQSLESTLVAQRSSAHSPPPSSVPPSSPPATQSNPLILWIAFFAVLGLSASVVLPWVVPDSNQTESRSN